MHTRSLLLLGRVRSSLLAEANNWKRKLNFIKNSRSMSSNTIKILKLIETLEKYDLKHDHNNRERSLKKHLPAVTNLRLYCIRLWARPRGFFFLSCLATLGVCPLTLPARAKDPWTLPECRSIRNIKQKRIKCERKIESSRFTHGESDKLLFVFGRLGKWFSVFVGYRLRTPKAKLGLGFWTDEYIVMGRTTREKLIHLSPARNDIGPQRYGPNFLIGLCLGILAHKVSIAQLT